MPGPETGGSAVVLPDVVLETAEKKRRSEPAVGQKRRLSQISDDVRFTPETGRGSARSRCPLSAKSGPCIAAKNPAGGVPSRPNVRAAASTSFALKDEIHQELKRGDREKTCANGRRQYGSALATSGPLS